MQYLLALFSNQISCLISISASGIQITLFTTFWAPILTRFFFAQFYCLSSVILSLLFLLFPLSQVLKLRFILLFLSVHVLSFAPILLAVRSNPSCSYPNVHFILCSQDIFSRDISLVSFRKHICLLYTVSIRDQFFQ